MRLSRSLKIHFETDGGRINEQSAYPNFTVSIDVYVSDLQAIQLMCVIILPVWRDEEAVELHKQRDHFIKLGDLKTEYVESTEILKFKAEQTVKIEI